MMKKNVSSIAIVAVIILILFLCHSITPAKSETDSKEQKVRIQSNKEVESYAFNSKNELSYEIIQQIANSCNKI